LTPQDFSKKLAQLTARAWSDDAFKKRLLSDPISVAKEYDIPVPPGSEIRIVEDTPTLRHFILPPRPPAEELSDELLEQVAGGTCVNLSRDSAALSDIQSAQLISNSSYSLCCSCGGCSSCMTF
jgi:hypothetical protein